LSTLSFLQIGLQDWKDVRTGERVELVDTHHLLSGRGLAARISVSSTHITRFRDLLGGPSLTNETIEVLFSTIHMQW